MKSSTALARVLALGLLICLAGSVAAQPAYPGKPMRFVVPFPPGGSTNFVARLVGQKLGESLGQQVIIDNRPGGNTVIGNEAVAKSAADGYTLLLATSTLVISPHLYPNLPYDAFKDFAAVATLIGAEYVLAVHPSVPANNLQELIAYAKSKPGQLNHAAPSSGSVQHLTIELFNMLAGVEIQNILYKGGGPAVTDLIGGQVQLSFASPVSVIPHIKSGRLKAIAITGATRFAALPLVPTLNEAGLPGVDTKTWFGVVVPAGTPKAVIDKLAAEIAKILVMPEIKREIANQGMDPFISTPEQFAALMKADSAKFGKIIKSANIKLEN